MARWRSVISRHAAALAAAGAVSLLVATMPASAVVPGSVSAKTPTRTTAGVLSGGGSFKNNATITQSYTYVIQLLRTTTPAAPSCAITGCVTGGTVTVLKTFPGSVSATRNQTVNLSTSHTCSASAVTRYYWTWLKVADTGGLVATSIAARALTGKFC